MQTVTASSLDKIFPDIGVTLPETGGVMLKNERYHFQVAVMQNDACTRYDARIKLSGDIAAFCTVRTVDCAPSTFNRYTDADDYYIFTSDDSRLYPDILREENLAFLPMGKWAAFWVTVYAEKGLPTGKHMLKIEISVNGARAGETEYALEVLDAELPEDDFPVAQWLHYDAIANYYNSKPWSKAYYSKLGSFIDHAVSHGTNMLYVPLFTPPLDTYVGGERVDVQLIKITKKDENYTFDLSELEKYLDFALCRGIKYFEMCHLATQWGAAHCPQIMAQTENGYERIFGWDTSSTSEDYLSFLRQCLRALDKLLRKKGLAERTYFHISDEPNKDNIARYKEVYEAIRPIIKNYKLMDAVSEVGRDIIDVPVVATTHLSGVCAENEFAYYCCCSYKQNLSNRFFDMPSLRNRILGCQLWLNKANGFLHWGFNFYNDKESVRAVNPFYVTDANGHFPAGDSFAVYPAPDGAWDSLRLEVFYDALQDRKLLCALQEKFGREKTVALLSEFGVAGWTEYPHTEKSFIEWTVKCKRMSI